MMEAKGHLLRESGSVSGAVAVGDGVVVVGWGGGGGGSEGEDMLRWCCVIVGKMCRWPVCVCVCVCVCFL